MNVDALVDNDTKKLLRAMTNLRIPTDEEIEHKKIKFGEKTKIKTLVLDMDETMIHSKFYPVSDHDFQTIKCGQL